MAQLHEFDLDRGIWNVPWQRMKARHYHTVPLSPQVIDLINAVGRTHNYPYVFHGRDIDKVLSNNAVLMFLKREFPHIYSTVHGFRSIPGLNEDDAYNEWTLISKPKNVRRPSDLCLEHLKENFKKLVSKENPDASYYPYFISKPDIEMILKYFRDKRTEWKIRKAIGYLILR